jgi:enoyl-CoA hydratase
MTEYQEILYRVEDRIATITFNRPQVHNAMSRRLRDEAVHALKVAEADDTVSLIVIDGAGPSFCSGYDVGAQSYDGKAHQISDLFDDFTDQMARGILRDWFTIWDLLKPVVAKVHGNCLAGGTEVMSMCDIAFVTDEARIGYPATRAQASPDLAFFAWKMTMARAKYLQLSGNIITGKQAADWGWVTKSFPEAEFEESFQREVKAIASIAPDMLGANKLALNQSYDIMGFRNALYGAVPYHYASAKARPNALEFRRIANADGLKAAVNWRDEPFREVDAPSRKKVQPETK